MVERESHRVEKMKVRLEQQLEVFIARKRNFCPGRNPFATKPAGVGKYSCVCTKIEPMIVLAEEDFIYLIAC